MAVVEPKPSSCCAESRRPKAGRIPFELTVTGCRIDRSSHQADRYYYDRTLLDQGWQQYDTEEDAWYFGIWINTERLETFTYAEGDTHHVIAPNVEAFRAELARLYRHHPCKPQRLSALTRKQAL